MLEKIEISKTLAHILYCCQNNPHDLTTGISFKITTKEEFDHIRKYKRAIESRNSTALDIDVKLTFDTKNVKYQEPQYIITVTKFF